MTKSYIIVGAGIGGLMTAQKIVLEQPNATVTIIERSSYPGGLLAGIQYPNRLYFDIGTHIFQETGKTAIDSYIKGVIPEEDLIIFENGTGDVSGAFFNGKLQTNTHFPDLRYHPNFERLFEALDTHVSGLSTIPPIDPLAQLSKVSKERFGQVITDEIINEIQSSIFKSPAEDLAGFCLLLTGVSRFIVSDEQKWGDFYTKEPFRSVYAFPEQLKLPKEYRHSRRSFYSKKRGSRNFINGIVSDLKQKGVQFLFNSGIEKFDIEKRIFFVNTDQVKSEITADRIIFSNGVIGAAKVCGIDLSSVSLDKPVPHTIYNLELTDTVNSPLCYFYGMDKHVDFYRVTNYRAFSGNENDKRISIEVLGKPEKELQLSDLLDQLYEMEFLTSKSLNFSDVLRLPAGFPSPTVKNMKGLNDIAALLYAQLPESVLIGGVGSKPGLFFQNDIVKDIYSNKNIILL